MQISRPMHNQHQGVIPQLLLNELRGRSEGVQTRKTPILIRRPAANAAAFLGSNLELSIIRYTAKTPRRSKHLSLSTKAPTMVMSEGKLDITWESSEKAGFFEKVNGTIAPSGTSLEIVLKKDQGTIYVASAHSSHDRTYNTFALPVSFSHTDIQRHLDGPTPVKLMVPANPHGYTIAKPGSRLLSNGSRDLIIGPENQEFSAGNALSRQDFHAHTCLTEAYIALDKLTIFYVSGGKTGVIEASNGDAVIVPPGIPHYVVMDSKTPTFVVMGSNLPILGDKRVISPHEKMAFHIKNAIRM